MPLSPDMRFEAGDVLHVTGHRASLGRLGEDLGHIERSVDETDPVKLGFGFAAGTFIGGISITVAGISVGLKADSGIIDTLVTPVCNCEARHGYPGNFNAVDFELNLCIGFKG